MRDTAESRLRALTEVLPDALDDQGVILFLGEAGNGHRSDEARAFYDDGK